MLETFNFIKKETLTQVFSYEFCEIFKSTFSTEHLWTAASALCPISSKSSHAQLCSKMNNFTSLCLLRVIIKITLGNL